MQEVEGALAALSGELEAFARNVSAVKRADDQLVSWNESFGRLVVALDILKQAGDDAPAVSKKSKRAVPERDGVNDENKLTAAGMKRKPEARAARGKKKAKTVVQVDEWQKVMKDLWPDLPKRYRLSSEEEKRLSTVWRTVNFKPGGSLLSEIVKVCGCSVLQANECLSVLTKLKLIARKKEKTVVKFVSLKKKNH